jgi:hypothetical protein
LPDPILQLMHFDSNKTIVYPSTTSPLFRPIYLKLGNFSNPSYLMLELSLPIVLDLLNQLFNAVLLFFWFHFWLFWCISTERDNLNLKEFTLGTASSFLIAFVYFGRLLLDPEKKLLSPFTNWFFIVIFL